MVPGLRCFTAGSGRSSLRAATGGRLTGGAGRTVVGGGEVVPRAEKRQRKKEQRRAKVEEELRQYRLQRRRRLSLFILVPVLLLGFVAIRVLFKGSKPAKKTSPVASSCPTKAPEMSIDSAKNYRATMETSMGTIVIDLDGKRAPKTVNSVVALARCKFYDGLIFHRVVKGFVIQGGDPEGSGNGGPGYSVTEAPPADLKYEIGTVAMAKTGAEAPGTSGSQFFIVSGPQGASLPAQYALLGKVSSGQDVVSKIDGVPVGDNDRPTDPPKIVKITVVEPVTPAATPSG
jgi:peptidyl-prolyl cis-trans isomerase B (cyclophilin B)